MRKQYWLVTWEQSLHGGGTIRSTEVSDDAPIHTLIAFKNIKGQTQTLTLLFAMPITLAQYREWNS